MNLVLFLKIKEINKFYTITDIFSIIKNIRYKNLKNYTQTKSNK